MAATTAFKSRRRASTCRHSIQIFLISALVYQRTQQPLLNLEQFARLAKLDLDMRTQTGWIIDEKQRGSQSDLRQGPSVMRKVTRSATEPGG